MCNSLVPWTAQYTYEAQVAPSGVQGVKNFASLEYLEPFFGDVLSVLVVALA